MKKKITKRAVDALKPDRSSDMFLWDTELRGFGVRVKPGGATTFVVSYYAPGLYRVRRRLTLGAYGPLTVDDARTMAKARLGEIADGKDPALEAKGEQRAAKEDTVDRFFADYLDHARAHFKEKTVESYEYLHRLYVSPAIGKLPVAKVTGRDIAKLHLELKDKPTTANRVVQLVKALFFWLERRELFSERNPASAIELYDEIARERFLTVEEMARIGQAIRVAETIGLKPAPAHQKLIDAKAKKRKPRARNTGMFTSEIVPASPVAVACLRFLIFTGWRESEARTLRWDAVNRKTGIATLADTKSGKSIRGIAAPALEVLEAQPRVKDSPYVFPGRDPQQPLEGINRLWAAVRYAAGLEGVRLHDLRHSVASFAGGRGYSIFLIGKLLGHRTGRSTERYAHLAEDIRKTMADDVGEVIREALASAPHTASVVPLRKA